VIPSKPTAGSRIGLSALATVDGAVENRRTAAAFAPQCTRQHVPTLVIHGRDRSERTRGDNSTLNDPEPPSKVRPRMIGNTTPYFAGLADRSGFVRLTPQARPQTLPEMPPSRNAGAL